MLLFRPIRLFRSVRSVPENNIPTLEKYEETVINEKSYNTYRLLSALMNISCVVETH